ncbi:MAG: exodeoxyribonuclease VII large subunit [Anaerolineaceae bacterium]
MLQPPLFPANSISVSELTRYLREWMESDELLRDVWVQGEISNLSRPSSGHIYFTIKDEYSALKCVIWRTSAGRASANLQSGLAVEVHGYVSIYERDGAYQLYVDTVRPAGEGSLFQEFLRLKARLEEEGLFDAARKKEIPQVPARIGIVTSPSGAALQDILNTLRRRYPLVEVVLAPAAVQGENAPAELAASIERLNREPGMDVIIVARGGGSLEDLWAFNDERVVRAVAASHVPIISGVGHETDFTLTDFAADLRAPTPTAAAEQAVPDQMDVRERLLGTQRRLKDALSGIAREEKLNLAEINRKLSQASPLMRVRSDRQRLDELAGRSLTGLQHSFEIKKTQTYGLDQRLKALNPYGVLKRGYAIVTNGADEIIRSVDQTFQNDALTIRICDGVVPARVSDEPRKFQAGEECND